MAIQLGHHGFQSWHVLHNDYLNSHPHVAAAAITSAIVLAGGIVYAASVPKVRPTSPDQEFVPASNLGVKNIFDLLGEFVQGLAKDIIGHEYPKYLPILIFIFMWTLANNLLGLIPTMGSATDSLNTTLAMGFAVFIYYNAIGFKTHGLKYLEHFTGHVHGALLLLLGPVLFVIELISHSVRPMTLGIRLRSNIYGDHLVYGIFTGLFKDVGAFLGEKLGVVGHIIGAVGSSLGPVPIMILGLLVCVIQAFVFTLLTTIYIGMATAHDDH